MIDITKALRVPGWMSPRELEWLASQAATRYRIVEVGSAWGRSTVALALHTPGAVLAVDDWQGPRDTALTADDRKYMLQSFLHNVACAGVGDKVYVCRENHREHVPHYKADMVFIDGDHSYEAIADDIRKFMATLGPGGLICGHDYEADPEKGYPGVHRAVNELLPRFGCVPDTTIWYAEIPA